MNIIPENEHMNLSHLMYYCEEPSMGRHPDPRYTKATKNSIKKKYKFTSPRHVCGWHLLVLIPFDYEVTLGSKPKPLGNLDSDEEVAKVGVGGGGNAQTKEVHALV